jgi:hypothetical protein
VTGPLVRVDLVAQTARVLNAGHPRPFRLRDRRAEEIDLAADQPFGLSAGASWSEREFPLETGDRVIFVTDGMLERNAPSLDIPALMLASARLHPRQTIHYLTHAVLDAVGGELRDDATSLCFDWHGGVQSRASDVPAVLRAVGDDADVDAGQRAQQPVESPGRTSRLSAPRCAGMPMRLYGCSRPRRATGAPTPSSGSITRCAPRTVARRRSASTCGCLSAPGSRSGGESTSWLGKLVVPKRRGVNGVAL